MISLHTLKGPKPVLFSMLNGEVRWQAVKLAQKRYKLSLKDITSVEEGKIITRILPEVLPVKTRTVSRYSLQKQPLIWRQVVQWIEIALCLGSDSITLPKKTIESVLSNTEDAFL